MKNFSVLASMIFILSIIGGFIGYVVIFSQFDVWFNFTAIFLLCVVTFAVGIGIVISALITEREV